MARVMAEDRIVLGATTEHTEHTEKEGLLFRVFGVFGGFMVLWFYGFVFGGNSGTVP